MKTNIINTSKTQVIHINNGINDDVKLYNYILNNINFIDEKIKMFGKIYTPKRKKYCMGDNDVNYKYSGIINKTNKWDNLILEIKNKISSITKQNYNFCLFNYYQDGDSYINWHSDNEKDIIPNSSIVSISLGNPRLFKLKNKTTKETKNIILNSGDILIMSGNCQNEYLHCVPKSKKYNLPRINLTFRLMKVDNEI
jgi:alkylated DNA repair dioxygenase AlkB